MPHDDLYSVPYNPGTKAFVFPSITFYTYRGYLFTHGGALGFHGKDVGLQLHEKKNIHKATLALKMMPV
jgi:hypothetical protein